MYKQFSPTRCGSIVSIAGQIPACERRRTQVALGFPTGLGLAAALFKLVSMSMNTLLPCFLHALLVRYTQNSVIQTRHYYRQNYLAMSRSIP